MLTVIPMMIRSSPSRSCPCGGKCPCHYTNDWQDVLLALLVLVSFGGGAVAAYLTWTTGAFGIRHQIHQWDESGISFILGMLLTGAVLILAFGFIYALVTLVKCLVGCFGNRNG
jgi:hypothetical protein